jgi:LPS export ABC transporter protein LptC
MGLKSVGIILTICLVACNSDYAQKNVAKMMQADTLICQQEGDQVVINYTDSGKLKAKIKVKKLLGYKKEGNEILKMPMGVKGEFFNDSGKIESYLTAEKGVSYQAQKITEVTQNVVVMNNKGEKLNTEKLIWDQRKQIIYTDKFVKITTKNEVLTGEGMESNQDFSNWVIKKPRGIISLQKDSIK